MHNSPHVDKKPFDDDLQGPLIALAGNGYQVSIILLLQIFTGHGLTQHFDALFAAPVHSVHINALDIRGDVHIVVENGAQLRIQPIEDM